MLMGWVVVGMFWLSKRQTRLRHDIFYMSDGAKLNAKVTWGVVFTLDLLAYAGLLWVHSFVVHWLQPCVKLP